MSTVNSASESYAKSHSNYEAAKTVVDQETAKYEILKEKAIWAQERDGSSDTSELDKAKDKLNKAKTQRNLADFDDTSKNQNLLNETLRRSYGRTFIA